MAQFLFFNARFMDIYISQMNQDNNKPNYIRYSYLLP